MAKQISADFEKTSYARRVNFISFRRTRVRRNDIKFTATKQVSESARLRMENFYDAISYLKFNTALFIASKLALGILGDVVPAVENR